MKIRLQIRSILIFTTITAVSAVAIQPIQAAADPLPEFKTTYSPSVPTLDELSGKVFVSSNSNPEGAFAGLASNQVVTSTTRFIVKVSTSIGAKPTEGGNVSPTEQARQFDSTTDQLAKKYGAINKVDLTPIGSEPFVFQRWEFPTAQVGAIAKSAVSTQSARANGIISIRPDIALQIQRTPNDPAYSNLWGMNAINAPAAWDITTGSRTIVTAVIDTGIQLNHPDLVNNIWINSGEISGDGIDNDFNGYIDDVNGWDFVDDDPNPSDDLKDRSGNAINSAGHGTHVAGTIAGVGNNGVGVAGVNWQASLMALRICGPYGCYLSDFWAALTYAYNNGAQVANASFGGQYTPMNDEQNLINSVAEPGDGPNQKGVLLVAAAGNNGSNNDFINFCPACYQLPNLVSVAAIRSATGELANFSNFGSRKVTIAAPGENIYSTLPVGAFRYNTNYGNLNGTSMAAPHVAGVAALFYSRSPTWKPAAVKKALIKSARKTINTSGKVFSGGIVDAAAVLNISSEPSPFLTLDFKGTGAGTVSINGVNCTTDCIKEIGKGLAVEIVATPNANSSFTSWGGDCTGTTTGTCTINQSGNGIYISITFNGPPLISHTQAALQSSESTPVWNNNTFGNYFDNSVNSAISADGNTRLRGIFRFPTGGWCSFAESDTGGVTAQNESTVPGEEQKKWTAPYVGPEQAIGRWSNCGEFGRNIQLSDDGDYATSHLGQFAWIANWASPSTDQFMCGTVLYKRTGTTWSNGVVIKPLNPTDCYANTTRTSTSWSGWGNWRTPVLAPDHSKLFVKGHRKVHVVNLSGDTVTTRETVDLPAGCLISSNLSSDSTGTKLLIPTFGCTDPANAYLFSKSSSGWVRTKKFNDVSAFTFGTTRTAISRDGNVIALSYTNEKNSGVLVYSLRSSAWVLDRDLNTASKFFDFTNCSYFTADNSRLICDARYVDVGANSRQGAIVIYDRSGINWSTSPSVSVLWDTNGSALQGLTFQGSNSTGTIIDSTISGIALGSGEYAQNFMGVTFKPESSAPEILTTPELTGSVSVGSTVNTSEGTWIGGPAPTLTYAWYSCTDPSANPDTNCIRIGTQDKKSFTITANLNLVGKYLRSAVTATNSSGTFREFSAATIAVGLKPVASINLSIQGSAVTGQTLSTAQPSWTGTPSPTYSYRWFRCDTAISRQVNQQPKNCTAIADQISSSYALTLSDFGKYIAIGVAGTNAHGEAWIMSKTSARIESPPLNSINVAVSGSPLIGQTLSAVKGTWTGTTSISLTYQWLLCSNNTAPDSCTSIAGATRNTYRLLNAQKGQYLRVREFAKNRISTVMTTSNPTTMVLAAPTFTGKLTHTGLATVGSTLTAASTLIWSGFPPPDVTTQWLRCKLRISSQTSSLPTHCLAIADATGDSYVLTSGDLSYFITVMRIGTSTAGITRVLAPSTRTTVKNS